MPRVLLIFAVVVLSSCSATKLSPDEPAMFAPAELAKRYTIEALDRDLEEYEQATGNPVKRKRIRDEMTYAVIALIRANFGCFEERFFSGRATGAAAFDVVNLGLDAAIAIVGGDRTKSILGALATAIHGSSISIDKHFFREKTSETILATMRADRTRAETAIKKKLQLEDNDYLFDEAWGDLIDLFYAGTVHSALITIAEQAGEKAQDAKKDASEVTDNRVEHIFGPPVEEAVIDVKREISTWVRRLSEKELRQAASAVSSTRFAAGASRRMLLRAFSRSMRGVSNATDVEALKQKLRSAGLDGVPGDAR